jgi:hypothetical protein
VTVAEKPSPAELRVLTHAYNSRVPWAARCGFDETGYPVTLIRSDVWERCIERGWLEPSPTLANFAKLTKKGEEILTASKSVFCTCCHCKRYNHD